VVDDALDDVVDSAGAVAAVVLSGGGVEVGHGMVTPVSSPLLTVIGRDVVMAVSELGDVDEVDGGTIVGIEWVTSSVIIE
jgi:hypothetical protein